MSETQEVKEVKTDLKVFSKPATSSLPYRDENKKLHYTKFYNHSALLKTDAEKASFETERQKQIDNKSPRTLFHFKEWNELVRPESQWVDFEDGSKVSQDEIVAGWKFAKEQNWTYEIANFVPTGSRAGTVIQGISTSEEMPKEAKKKGKVKQ